MTEKIIDWLERFDPEDRRRWAVRLCLLNIPLWVLGDLGIEVLPEKFFQHILWGISMLAIQLALVLVVLDTDIRKQQENNGQ